MARPRIVVQPGALIGGREVIRELPTPLYGRRTFLVKCRECGMLTRGEVQPLRKSKCYCTRGCLQDSETFRTTVAPKIASNTGTIYGGMGRFWLVHPDGDMRVRFIVPKEIRRA